MAMNRVGTQQAANHPKYASDEPACIEAPASLMSEANSLAAELEKRALNLGSSIDGFADGLLGSEPQACEACRENPQPPGELYRLMTRLRAAHAAMSLAETAFGRLRPAL